MVDFIFAIIEHGSDVISRYWSKSAFFKGGWVTFTAYIWNETSPTNICRCQKTRMFLLTDSEDRVILSSFVWIGHQYVTDRQTDEIAVANTALCIASNEAEL